MTTYTATTLTTGLGFGEGPRWHDGRLWFSDFYRHGIFSVAADGTDERLEHAVVTQPSGLDWTSDGTLYFVSMIDHTIRSLRNGVETTILDFSEHCGFWANDMTMNSAAPTTARVSPSVPRAAKSAVYTVCPLDGAELEADE